MKRVAYFISIMVLAACLSFGAAYAGSDVIVKVNDMAVRFPDARPYIDENDRTMIPIRFVAEKLEAKVGWNGKTSTVTFKKSDISIELTIGKSEAKVNNVVKKFDTKAVLKQDRTFVPLRFVSETLGAKVEWFDKLRIVEITTPEWEKLSIEEKYDPKYAPEEFKEIAKKLDKAEIKNSQIIMYSNDGTSDFGDNDFFISCDEKSDYLGIKKYDEKTLNDVKEVLKVYYPQSYETVYKQVIQVIKTGNKVERKYYDNRYFASYKFTGSTSVIIGNTGVKMEW